MRQHICLYMSIDLYVRERKSERTDTCKGGNREGDVQSGDDNEGSCSAASSNKQKKNTQRVTETSMFLDNRPNSTSDTQTLSRIPGSKKKRNPNPYLDEMKTFKLEGTTDMSIRAI